MMRPALLLIFGAAVNINADGLDLYIRSKYGKTDGSKCGSCTDEGNGCILASESYFVQSSCFNRGINRASIYDEVDVEDKVLCRQDVRTSCDNSNPEFDAEDADDCRATWKLKECTDSEMFVSVKDWCIESDEPVGEYTVPMVAFQEYTSLAECELGDDYFNLLLPDQGGVCRPFSFDSNGTSIAGSQKVSCKGETFGATRYKSNDCTGETVDASLDGTSDTCPTSSDAEFVYTNNCGSPDIYCKAAIWFSGSGSSEGLDIGEDSDAKTNTNAGGKDTITTGLFMAATVLLSWFL